MNRAGHGAGVVVAGYAGALIRKGFLEQFGNGFSGVVRPSGPVVKDRDEKAWLVGDVEVFAIENVVETAHKHPIASRQGNQPSHILRSVERIGPEVALVKKVGPGTAYEQVWLGPTAVRVAGAQEALEAFHGEVFVPEMFPIAGASGEEPGLGWAIEPAGYFRDGEIVVGVLHGAGAGALVGQCQVAFGVVLEDAAAALLLRVGRGDGSVFQHGFKSGGVIDASQTFDEGVGEDEFGVAAALGAAVVSCRCARRAC